MSKKTKEVITLGTPDTRSVNMITEEVVRKNRQADETIGLETGSGHVIAEKLNTLYQEVHTLVDSLITYPKVKMVDEIRGAISYKVAGGLVYTGNETLMKIEDMDRSIMERQDRAKSLSGKEATVERTEKEAAFYKRQLKIHETLPLLVHWLCTPSTDQRIMLEILPFQDMAIRMLERNTSSRDFGAIRHQIKSKYYDFKKKQPRKELMEERREDMEFVWSMSGVTVPEAQKEGIVLEGMLDDLRYEIRDARDKVIAYRTRQGTIASMWRQVTHPILEDKARDVHDDQVGFITEQFHYIDSVPSFVLGKVASKTFDALFEAVDNMTRDSRGRRRRNHKTGRPTYSNYLAPSERVTAKALVTSFKWSMLNEIKPMVNEIERLVEEEREIGLQDSGREDMKALMDKLREFE